MACILICSTVLVAYFSATVHSAKTVEWFGVAEADDAAPEKSAPATRGEWLECFPLLSLIVGLGGLAYLPRILAARGPPPPLDLHSYHFLFLLLRLRLPSPPVSFTP